MMRFMTKQHFQRIDRTAYYLGTGVEYREPFDGFIRADRMNLDFDSSNRDEPETHNYNPENWIEWTVEWNWYGEDKKNLRASLRWNHSFNNIGGRETIYDGYLLSYFDLSAAIRTAMLHALETINYLPPEN